MNIPGFFNTNFQLVNILLRLFLLNSFCVVSAIGIYAQGGGKFVISPLAQVDKEFLVVLHYIHGTNSQPANDIAQFNSQLELVNSIFNPIHASFTVCETRHIYNSNYDTLNNISETQVLAKYYAYRRINIFLIADFKDNPFECGNASLGGVSYSTPNGIFVKKGACLTATTIAHELGHYFNLNHTFAGSSEELADGSNCSTAGDKICDTPADPFIPGDSLKYYVKDCHFISLKKDAKSKYYDPDISNIMSYYTPCICNKFTRKQYEAMANFYLANKLVW